jgi:hypothetical protein
MMLIGEESHQRSGADRPCNHVSASLAMPVPCKANCRIHSRLSLEKVPEPFTCSGFPLSFLKGQRSRPGAVKAMQRWCARSAGVFGAPNRSKYLGWRR